MEFGHGVGLTWAPQVAPHPRELPRKCSSRQTWFTKSVATHQREPTRSHPPNYPLDMHHVSLSLCRKRSRSETRSPDATARNAVGRMEGRKEEGRAFLLSPLPPFGFSRLVLQVPHPLATSKQAWSKRCHRHGPLARRPELIGRPKVLLLPYTLIQKREPSSLCILVTAILGNCTVRERINLWIEILKSSVIRSNIGVYWRTFRNGQILTGTVS